MLSSLTSLADLPVEHGLFDPAEKYASGPLRGRERIPVVLERLRVRSDAARLIACAEQILLRLAPVVRLREVMRQHRIELLDLPCEELFKRLADLAVQFSPALLEQTVVRRLLNQRVLEHIFQLGQTPSFLDQLRPLQDGQVRVERRARLRHGPEHPVEEAAPHHRRRFQHLLGFILESIDTTDDDALDGPGQRRFGEPRGGLPLRSGRIANHRTTRDQHAHELFHEQRIAAGAVQQQPANRTRQARARKKVRCHPKTVVRRQHRQGDRRLTVSQS